MHTKFWCLLSVVSVLLQSAGAQISWQRVWGPAPVTVEAITFDRGGRILAGTSGLFYSGRGIIRSTDGGDSWSASNAGLADTNVSALLTVPNGDLFAGVWTLGGGQTGCVYRSHDNGNTWTRIDSGLVGTSACFAMIVDSTGTFLIGVQGGGKDVCRSTDNGTSWVPTTAFTPNGCYALAVHPDSTIFAGTLMTGMCRTTDKGITWDTINNGLTNKFVYALLATPRGVIFAGTGGFFATGVFRSTDRGAHWEQTALDSAMIGALASSVDGTIFAGTTSSGVFSSTNNGDSWVEQNSGLTGLHVTSLAVSPKGYLFAGTDSAGIFRSTKPLTSVSDKSIERPRVFILSQNYPNPFNPTTIIKYELPRSSSVRLSVYDILGREVCVLVNEGKNAGVHEVKFDASGFSSGVYLYRIQAGEFVQTRRALLLK